MAYTAVTRLMQTSVNMMSVLDQVLAHLRLQKPHSERLNKQLLVAHREQYGLAGVVVHSQIHMEVQRL